MKFLIIFIFLIIGCDETRPQIYAEKSYCHDACLQHYIETLHKSDSQFLGGAAASSLNGFNENNVLNKFYQYCRYFYQEKKCCTSNGSHQNFHYVHGYRFGPCNEGYGK